MKEMKAIGEGEENEEDEVKAGEKEEVKKGEGIPFSAKVSCLPLSLGTALSPEATAPSMAFDRATAASKRVYERKMSEGRGGREGGRRGREGRREGRRQEKE